MTSAQILKEILDIVTDIRAMVGTSSIDENPNIVRSNN